MRPKTLCSVLALQLAILSWRRPRMAVSPNNQKVIHPRPFTEGWGEDGTLV